MNGPGEYYANENKSVRKRQIPYDFTYMYSLKNKINEQTKLKQTHRYRGQNNSCQRKSGSE